jgi:nitroreductase
MLDLIKSRRSIRKFLEKPIPSEILLSLLEAARWAPSGGNIQPWLFVAVRKVENIRKIKMFSPGLGGIPTALVIICSDEAVKDSTAIMDISMAAENVMLLATHEGLGSCCVRSFNQKAIQSLLKLPPEIIPELIITLGYPGKTARTPKKKSIDEIVHWEEYGGIENG